MPTDTAFPYEYTETGDTAAVDGENFYAQHAQLLALLATAESDADPLTANGQTKIVSDVRDRLRSSPHFVEPVVVSVADVSGETLTLEVDAQYREGILVDVNT